MLIYHGLGTGKTATAICVFNALYQHFEGWNIYILIKATLKDDPWLKDLRDWLRMKNKEDIISKVFFISYDAPNVVEQFENAINKSDQSKHSYYIIDEAHNFISKVYGNLDKNVYNKIYKVYTHIQKDLTNNKKTRLILLSATPAINYPFEMSVLFNLLRPGTFP